MQSHYRINVSLNGRHFFATAEHSCVDVENTESVFKEIQERFPKKDGFEVTCTHWDVSGSRVNFD